jgi:hypothetical protein
MSDVVQEGAVEQAAPLSATSSPLPVKQDYGTGINVVVKHATFDGEIDLSKLTWRDNKNIRSKRKAVQDGTMTEDELLDMLDDLIRKLTGVEPDDLPAEVVDKITEILFVGDARAKEAEKN